MFFLLSNRFSSSTKKSENTLMVLHGSQLDRFKDLRCILAEE